jgi:hypothetical protein
MDPATLCGPVGSHSGLLKYPLYYIAYDRTIPSLVRRNKYYNVVVKPVHGNLGQFSQKYSMFGRDVVSRMVLNFA